MDIEHFHIDGPALLTPRVFADDRGFFMETFSAPLFQSLTGASDSFVQDNQSFSRHAGTLRGLHFQAPPHAQGKLVRCTRGSVTDAIVDIRRKSATYGQWICVHLSAENKQQLWVPPGFLHGFVTLEPDTEFVYKVTGLYNQASDGGVIWNDPDLDIDWGLGALTPILSEKDTRAQSFADFESPF